MAGAFVEKFALITGASSGIGEAFAKLLAAQGYGLVLVARDEKQLNRIAGVLTSKHNLPIHVLGKDLTETKAGLWVVEELKRRNIEPDLVINNAGFGLSGTAAELSASEQVAMTQLNVRALTELTLYLLPEMKKKNSGGFINVASVASFMSGPYMAVYFASKAYILSFGEALAYELHDSDITVTTLCPGPVSTNFQDRAGLDNPAFMRFIKPATPETIAAAGLEGFHAKQAVIIPGLINQIAVFAMRFMPRQMRLSLVASMQKPK